MILSRRRVLFAAVLVIALGGAFAYRDNLAGKSAPVVTTSTVVRGDVTQTVLASGTLMPVKLVAVGAQASGRILSMKVVLGQRVKAGDLIASIDSVKQENSLKSAEADLANIRAQKAEKEATLAYSQAALERRRLLLEGRASSREEFESAETTVKTTQRQIEALAAQIAGAEVSVATARNDLAYTRIIAPMDGTVLAVVSQEGQTVNATQSAPTIVVLGDLSRMTIRAEISEADVVRVRPGQPVKFTILGEPERSYSASLATIDPAPDSIKNDSSISTSTSSTSASSSASSSSTSSAIYYFGRFEIDNADGHLMPYMTAQVGIQVAEARGVLTVPSAALGARGADGRRVVRVLADDGEIATRHVEVGVDNKVVVEVRAGLSEHELVVTGERTAVTATKSFAPPGPPGGL